MNVASNQDYNDGGRTHHSEMTPPDHDDKLMFARKHLDEIVPLMTSPAPMTAALNTGARVSEQQLDSILQLFETKILLLRRSTAAAEGIRAFVSLADHGASQAVVPLVARLARDDRIASIAVVTHGPGQVF